MAATLIQTEERPTTQRTSIDQLESLVPAAVRLAQLRQQQMLSEPEFEAGLTNLFRTARDAQASLGLDYHRVHLDWSEDPVTVERGSSEWCEALYARVDQRLQPYFAYAWEYSDGAAREAVRFDEQESRSSDSGSDRSLVIKGAWVDLVR